MKAVLAVSLNSAWQKTLTFNNVVLGEVNRAFECHEAGGGKGVNVARVFRLLGYPVALAAFIGGHTGACLHQEIQASGILDMTVPCIKPLRCCYTVIDRSGGKATELIEPSGSIEPSEVSALLALLDRHMGEFSAVALCGSLPPGVPEDIYARLAAMAAVKGVPVVLDAVKNIEPVLEVGVRLLKINRSELQDICGKADMLDGANALLARFPKLEWLAVTDGAEPAGLFCRGEAWRIALPRLERIVSPIGGGDCATALMTRFVATQNNDSQAMVEAFAFALACASASCLTDTPSVFDMDAAKAMKMDIAKQ